MQMNNINVMQNLNLQEKQQNNCSHSALSVLTLARFAHKKCNCTKQSFQMSNVNESNIKWQSTPSKLKQMANPQCGLVNSTSYPQWD